MGKPSCGHTGLDWTEDFLDGSSHWARGRILDGEVVALDHGGAPDSRPQAALSEDVQKCPTYFVFDIP
jgi:ATP-dependent DNA ligase